jgi:hypothetical protein
LDCGNSSSLAAAEDSCISWGTGVYGELGYGSTGPKCVLSSTSILLTFLTAWIACMEYLDIALSGHFAGYRIYKSMSGLLVRSYDCND